MLILDYLDLSQLKLQRLLNLERKTIFKFDISTPTTLYYSRRRSKVACL